MMMKKYLMMLSFVLFSVPFQINAATLAWVSTPPSSAVQTVTATNPDSQHLGGFVNFLSNISSPFTHTWTYQLNGSQFVDNAVIEIFDNSMVITSVKLDGNILADVVQGSGTFATRLWTLPGNLAGGLHSLVLDFASAKINGQYNVIVSTVVPVPAAIWLFGSALLGLVGFSRRKSHSTMAV
jgi:hypothetical protein